MSTIHDALPRLVCRTRSSSTTSAVYTPSPRNAASVMAASVHHRLAPALVAASRRRHGVMVGNASCGSPWDAARGVVCGRTSHMSKNQALVDVQLGACSTNSMDASSCVSEHSRRCAWDSDVYAADTTVTTPTGGRVSTRQLVCTTAAVSCCPCNDDALTMPPSPTRKANVVLSAHSAEGGGRTRNAVGARASHVKLAASLTS